MGIKRRFNLNQAIREGIQGTSRFPLPVFSTILLAICIVLAFEPDLDLDQMPKWILTFLLAIPLFTAIRLLADRMNWHYNLQEIVLTVVGAGFLVVYHQSLPPVEDFGDYIGVPVRLIGFLFILHLMVSYIPFLGKTSDHDFWEYNKQLFARWIVGAIYVGIIFLGLSLALLALDQLFGVNVEERRYAQLFAVIGGFFHAPYFYSSFPKDFEFGNNEIAYNKFFINLCKYILIPIIVLYFVILYAYGIKIMVLWELPRGWVSSLVLSMSIAGILTYLLNYKVPLFDRSKWVGYFNQYFWIAFLPLILLLAVAIYRRIDDYGVTEARFVVATTVVCLFIITILYLYFDFTNRKRNIIWIPFILSLFTLLTILGPFNAMKVSQANQSKRLWNYLSESGMIQDGKISFDTKEVSNDQKDKIRETLLYLNNRHAEKTIRSWLPDTFKAENEAWTILDVLSNMNLTHQLTEAYNYEWLSDSHNNLKAYDIQAFSALQRLQYFNDQNDSIRAVGLVLQINEDSNWKDIGDFTAFYQMERGSFTSPDDAYQYKTYHQPIHLNDSTAFIPNNLRIQSVGDSLTIQSVDGWLLQK